MIRKKVARINDISLSLREIFSGTAIIVISSMIAETEYCLSYVGTDSLCGFVISAIRLLNNEETRMRFMIEPETIPFKTIPCENNVFEMHLEDNVFHGTIKRYARQVLQMFDNYIWLYGEEKYNKEWGHDYPKRELERLRDELRKLKITT